MNSELTPAGYVLIAFLILFSIGMDVYHTGAINSEKQEIYQSPAPLTDSKTKTYEVYVVWKRQSTIGGGAFPEFKDTDWDSDGPIYVKTATYPDSATVASQAEPPAPGFVLDRVKSAKRVK